MLMETISLPPVMGKGLQERDKGRGEDDRAVLYLPLSGSHLPWMQDPAPGLRASHSGSDSAPFCLGLFSWSSTCTAGILPKIYWHGGAHTADISWRSPRFSRPSIFLSSKGQYFHMLACELNDTSMVLRSLKYPVTRRIFWDHLLTPIFSASQGGCQGWGCLGLCSGSVQLFSLTLLENHEHDGRLDPEVLCCLVHVRDDPQHPNKHQDLCSQDLAQNTLNKLL